MRQPATTGAGRRGARGAVRAAARWLAVLLLAAAGLSAALWVFRVAAAEWAVAWFAARQGFAPASVTIDEIGFGRLVARDLRLGRDGALGLDRLEADYSLAGLIGGRADAVTVRGLRVDARIEPDRIVIAAADPPMTISRGDGGPPRLPRLPASRIDIADARLGLETNEDRITVALDGAVQQGDDGRISFELEAALRHDRAQARLAWNGSARGNPDQPIVVRIASRHRVTVGPITAEGDAAFDVEQSAAALSVAFDMTDMSVRGDDVQASEIAGRGRVRLGEQGVRAVEANLRIGALRAGGLDAALPRLAVSYDGARVAAEGRLTGDAGEVAFSAGGETSDAARPVAFDLEGFLRAAAVAPLLPGRARAAGRVTFDLAGQVRSPIDAATAAPGDWRRLFGLATMAGKAGLDLSEVAVGDGASADAVTTDIDLRLADGALRVESQTGLTATGIRLAAAWSARLPQAVRDQLAEPPASISIGGAGGSQFAAILRPRADGSSFRVVSGLRAESGSRSAAAELDARLDLDPDLAPRNASLAYLSLTLKGLRHRGMTADVDALLNDFAGTTNKAAGYLSVTASARGALPGTNARTRATLDLNGALELADRRVSLTPDPDSKAVVRRLDLPGTVRLAAPLTMGLGGAGSQITVPLDGGDIGARLRLAPMDAALDVAEHGRVGLSVGDAVANVTGDTYRIVLSGGALTGEAAPFAAEGIAGRLGWGPGATGTARLGVARLRHTGAPALVAPLALEIEADVRDGRGAFAVRSKPGAPGAAVSVKGRYDLAQGRGAADVAVGPVRFAPGGLQPGALSPRLAGVVEDAEGSLGIAGTIELDADGLHPRLTVSLDGLGFATEPVRVAGIEGRVLVDGLAPPTTAAGQRVVARVVLGALPPMPATARFRLRPDGALAIEHASLAFAGGRLATENVVADLRALDTDAAVDVADLSVERLLALLKIPELGGTGTLGGRIDVRLRGGRVASAKGTLSGAGAGILRISDPAVLQNLAKREDTVGLAMKALANFRYESLAIDMDVRNGAAGKVLVRLKGANPEVLEGYPFAFNINLETDFGRLAELVTSGARSAEAFIGTTLGDAVR